MTSIKCPKCGLINFETEKTCKRCQAFLNFSGSKPDEMPSENNKNQVITRNKEIVIGLLTLLAGLFILVNNWMWAMNKGEFPVGLTIMAPVAIAFGLCFLLFPYQQKEHFPKAEFAPKIWAVLLIPGIILGVLNYLYFSGVI
jgi:Mg2+/citrate symporter